MSTLELVFLDHFKHASNAGVFIIPIRVRQDKITVIPKSWTTDRTDRHYSQPIRALTRYKTLHRQELTRQLYERQCFLGTEILVLSPQSVTYIIKQITSQLQYKSTLLSTSVYTRNHLSHFSKIITWPDLLYSTILFTKSLAPISKEVVK